MNDTLRKQKILTSGFIVMVKPLPPYYMDFIEDTIPMPELPKRAVKLAAGDTIYFEYKLPEVEPAVADPDYDLYLRYMSTLEEIKKIEAKQERVRRDFLLSNCVDVEDGPVELDSEEWVIKLESSVPGFHVPKDPGGRRLTFLKSIVITTIADMNDIVKLSVFQEATMQGILNALQGFQPKVG
jgi:hypothetical protein